MAKVFIGMGSNLENPLRQIQAAIKALKQLPQSIFLKSSSLYRSKPLGLIDQSDFINAVVVLETHLSPLALLDQLQALELQQGRERKLRWGPRTLDLDLLLYEQQEMQSERLVLPHPELKNRIFVLQPLLEVDPELVLPSGEAISTLLKKMGEQAQSSLILFEKPPI